MGDLILISKIIYLSECPQLLLVDILDNTLHHVQCALYMRICAQSSHGAVLYNIHIT